ncbi:MAG TPA: hypothetical protein VGO00_08865, partial [Kofleriaceae bacterium]|nr:hypothetical protein [Kofleriaceae bacterium]
MIAILTASGVARADDFLKSSPGELATGHASLDKQDKCLSCHDNDNSVPSAKCIGCHDKLRARVASGQGFHVSDKVRGHDCKACHKEHRGRSFDLMGWQSIGGIQSFDHQLAGWKLEGKHAVTDCAHCHKTADRQGLRMFVGADRTCGGCHAKDQPHGAVRAQTMHCDRCHTDKVWKPQKAKLDFNHDDPGQAAMPLEGSHADVACAKCHAKAAFKLPDADKDCAGCHNSPHDGQLFGTKSCKTCHSAALRTLKEVRFDHKKQTGYALVGAHSSVACASCHVKSLGTSKPAASCESCHARDNKHGNRFDKLPKCSTCHSQRAWKSSFQFNHADNTKFDLTGKHANASCRACHRGKTPSEFERFDINNGCMSCHKHGKAHGGKFKNDQCLTCHAEGGSKKMRKDSLEVFHGENSKFPLRNGHAGVQCQMCHVNDVYQETPRECGVSCHEDSLHRGSLGQECSRCHEPGQWPAIRFDHTKQTKWPLAGKHADVKSCDSCHPGRQFHGAATSCGAAGCHKNDDVHQGKL